MFNATSTPREKVYLPFIEGGVSPTGHDDLTPLHQHLPSLLQEAGAVSAQHGPGLPGQVLPPSATRPAQDSLAGGSPAMAAFDVEALIDMLYQLQKRKMSECAGLLEFPVPKKRQKLQVSLNSPSEGQSEEGRRRAKLAVSREYQFRCKNKKISKRKFL